MVCVGVFGESVEGKVQAGFVPHGRGFEYVEGGRGGGRGLGYSYAGTDAGLGVRKEREIVCVRIGGTCMRDLLSIILLNRCR